MEQAAFSWLLGMLIAACALRAYLNHDLRKELYAFGFPPPPDKLTYEYYRTCLNYTTCSTL